MIDCHFREESFLESGNSNQSYFYTPKIKKLMLHFPPLSTRYTGLLRCKRVESGGKWSMSCERTRWKVDG